MLTNTEEDMLTGIYWRRYADGDMLTNTDGDMLTGCADGNMLTGVCWLRHADWNKLTWIYRLRYADGEMLTNLYDRRKRHLPGFCFLPREELLNAVACRDSPTVTHLQWLTCSDSPAVTQLQWLTCSDSTAVSHLQELTCSESPAVVACSDSLAGTHLQWFTCSDSPAVTHMQWLNAFTLLYNYSSSSLRCKGQYFKINLKNKWRKFLPYILFHQLRCKIFNVFFSNKRLVIRCVLVQNVEFDTTLQ